MPLRVLTLEKMQPRQSRSRVTVEALVEATAIVLKRRGYEGTTTINRVAAVAGVNIASLYQYFPSKEALVAAVIDRHLERIARAVGEALQAVANANLSASIQAAVRAHLALHAGDAALHRLLLSQVPRLERTDPTIALRKQVIQWVQSILPRYAAQLREHDWERAAFIAVHSIDGLTQAAILERPEYLGDAAYADEVASVVLRYLVVDAPSTK